MDGIAWGVIVAAVIIFVVVCVVMAIHLKDESDPRPGVASHRGKEPRMAEPERTESMYDRVAGEVGIRTLVERFYYLVLSDPTVARYFPTDSIRQGTLRRHFALAVGQVLGGPKFVDDPVAAIHQAHVGLGISAQDYWRVISYLFFTMDKLGVPDDIVAHVSATVWALKDAVVEEEEVHPSYVGQ